MASRTELEVRRVAREFGGDLAAALVLVSERGDVDRELRRQMARIVLDQIEGAVQKLRNAAYPADLTEIYERSVRQGVRDELKRQAIGATCRAHLVA